MPDTRLSYAILFRKLSSGRQLRRQTQTEEHSSEKTLKLRYRKPETELFGERREKKATIKPRKTLQLNECLPRRKMCHVWRRRLPPAFCCLRRDHKFLSTFILLKNNGSQVLIYSFLVKKLMAWSVFGSVHKIFSC